MQFQLNQVQHSKNLTGTNQPIATKENWVTHFAGKFEPSSFKELEKESPHDVTHAGFVYYLHQCWAKEIGACLRPDMFWYTIVSELSKMVLDNVEDFRHLFSDSDEKKDIIVLTNDETDINVEILIKQMRDVIKDKDFLNTICNTQFDSQVPNSNKAILMTFACMATPYFNYMSTSCGIPHLRVEGSQHDWEKLYNACKDLRKFQPKSTSRFGMDGSDYLKYIDRITNLVGTIIFYSFDVKIQAVTIIGKNKTDFFNGVFHYGKNTRCGSGHDAAIVQGWIKDLYFNSWDRDLYKFNTHINYVPYENIETKRMFCQVTGLTYSLANSDTNTLHAQYGFVKYEVLDRKVFNDLAKK